MQNESFYFLGFSAVVLAALQLANNSLKSMRYGTESTALLDCSFHANILLLHADSGGILSGAKSPSENPKEGITANRN